LTVTVGTPAFSLSSVAETRVATTAITGYTITSTGAPITSYSLVETLTAGLSFDTSTGRITGTPTETRTATTYTIIGASASGETATATYRLRVTGDIGDDGPGGGVIYYYRAAGFSCGPTLATTCTYLEAAPSGWNTVTDPTLSWATNVNSNQTTTVPAPGAIQTDIGTGYKNSNAIVAQTGNVAGSSAAVAARAYGGNGLTDWYLPSKDELNQMCKWVRGVAWTSDATVCTGGTMNTGPGAAGFDATRYWSSTERDADEAWFHNLDLRSQNFYLKNYDLYSVRPIRAF
jgi:hypothetical protein